MLGIPRNEAHIRRIGPCHRLDNCDQGQGDHPKGCSVSNERTCQPNPSGVRRGSRRQLLHQHDATPLPPANATRHHHDDSRSCEQTRPHPHCHCLQISNVARQLLQLLHPPPLTRRQLRLGVQDLQRVQSGGNVNGIRRVTKGILPCLDHLHHGQHRTLIYRVVALHRIHRLTHESH
jgi:hypothetical protein